MDLHNETSRSRHEDRAEPRQLSPAANDESDVRAQKSPHVAVVRFGIEQKNSQVRIHKLVIVILTHSLVQLFEVCFIPLQALEV